jgi:hypothetical protein
VSSNGINEPIDERSEEIGILSWSGHAVSYTRIRSLAPEDGDSTYCLSESSFGSGTIRMTFAQRQR